MFSGRTTYTAILVLRRGAGRFRYRAYRDLDAAQRSDASVDHVLDTTSVDDGVWSFDEPDLLALHGELAQRHGTIGSHQSEVPSTTKS